MNREILFRAKRVDNGEWVDGYLFDNDFVGVERKYFVGCLVIEEYKGNACDEWDITGINFCEVDPDTICQYTGLTDKNGKKIWENDIFKCYLLNKYASIKYGTYQIGFDSRLIINVGFYADWSEDSSLKLRKDLGYWVNVEEIEIIGNIFDSSELLDEKRGWSRLSYENCKRWC